MHRMVRLTFVFRDLNEITVQALPERAAEAIIAHARTNAHGAGRGTVSWLPDQNLEHGLSVNFDEVVMVIVEPREKPAETTNPTPSTTSKPPAVQTAAPPADALATAKQELDKQRETFVFPGAATGTPS